MFRESDLEPLAGSDAGSWSDDVALIERAHGAEDKRVATRAAAVRHLWAAIALLDMAGETLAATRTTHALDDLGAINGPPRPPTGWSDIDD